MLRSFTPDRAKAVAAFNSFDYNDCKEQLSALVGKGAETMIRHEERIEHKYDKENFLARLDRIIEKSRRAKCRRDFHFIQPHRG